MLSIVVMNKRSILTAVLALGLGVTALTGCSDNTGANYVTPRPSASTAVRMERLFISPS